LSPWKLASLTSFLHQLNPFPMAPRRASAAFGKGITLGPRRTNNPSQKTPAKKPESKKVSRARKVIESDSEDEDEVEEAK
jgi:hypothetical protein